MLSYLRDSMSANQQARIGHNALGGWSVLALLASVTAQSVSGLFASDDIDTDGPLVAHVSDATVKLMTRLHHWNENVLLILVCLHVVAVLSYLLVKHDDLITPMFSGSRRDGSSRPISFASSRFALALFAACAAVVALLAWWAG